MCIIYDYIILPLESLTRRFHVLIKRYIDDKYLDHLMFNPFYHQRWYSLVKWSISLSFGHKSMISFVWSEFWNGMDPLWNNKMPNVAETMSRLTSPCLLIWYHRRTFSCWLLPTDNSFVNKLPFLFNRIVENDI